jgi:hypothetical protein
MTNVTTLMILCVFLLQLNLLSSAMQLAAGLLYLPLFQFILFTFLSIKGENIHLICIF